MTQCSRFESPDVIGEQVVLDHAPVLDSVAADDRVVLSFISWAVARVSLACAGRTSL